VVNFNFFLRFSPNSKFQKSIIICIQSNGIKSSSLNIFQTFKVSHSEPLEFIPGTWAEPFDKLIDLYKQTWSVGGYHLKNIIKQVDPYFQKV